MDIEGIFKAAALKERQFANFTIDLESVPSEEHSDRPLRVAVIRTSDRNSFRSCRRKWNWSSHLRENIRPKQNASPLWFGSGLHFVFEDYHGLRKFEDPCDALQAYAKATYKYDAKALPDDWRDLLVMGEAMLKYYQKWEAARPELLPTYYVDGVPQVEINFRIPIPVSAELLAKYGYDKAEYSGTIDRIVYDKHLGMLWVLDYKSAKIFQTQHFQTDSQISTYVWAAACIYEKPVAGMIYAQHLKRVIELPRVLKSGHMSTAQNQLVTSITYREQMLNVYGSEEEAPEDIQKYLTDLEKQEDARQDRYVRYDYIHKGEHAQAAEGAKILMEVVDMLNPDLELYPNPSRDCANFCSFVGPCVSLDDGSHFEDDLALNYRKRPAEYDGWREFLVWPGDEPEPEVNNEVDWFAVVGQNEVNEINETLSEPQEGKE